MQVKRLLAVSATIVVVLFIGWRMKTTLSELDFQVVPSPSPVRNMKLTSSAFDDGGEIPVAFTCRGENKNPPLFISEVPPGAKFLALEVNDPDAPLGLFVHWIIWNIDPQTRNIESGIVPDKAQEGTNSTGKIGYTGPCPPSRHRYFFKLLALDTKIGLDGKANAADLEKAMSGHIIAQTTLTGIFGIK